MDDLVYIGYITSTHGIKGEIRIVSDFEIKEKVFIPGTIIYIGKSLEENKIITYRHHKEYEMVTLEKYNNINDVIKFKKMKVFVKRDMLNLKENEYLLQDLIDMEVIYNDKTLGKIEEIVYNKSNILLHVIGNENFYIPTNPEFIEKVDLTKKKIYVKNIEGLII